MGRIITPYNTRSGRRPPGASRRAPEQRVRKIKKRKGSEESRRLRSCRRSEKRGRDTRRRAATDVEHLAYEVCGSVIHYLKTLTGANDWEVRETHMQQLQVLQHALSRGEGSRSTRPGRRTRSRREKCERRPRARPPRPIPLPLSEPQDYAFADKYDEREASSSPPPYGCYVLQALGLVSEG